LVPVQAQVVQGVRQRPAIARSSAAGDQVGEDRGQAQVGGRIVHAAGGYQEVEGGRAHVLHSLGQQSQAVGEGVVVDFLSHAGVLLFWSNLEEASHLQDAVVIFDGLVNGLTAAEADPA